MFQGARRRLAFRYVALFMLVQAVFSLGLLVVLAVALRPAFDLAPELSNAEAARQAYGSTLWTIGIALGVADIAVLSLVAAAAYYLAGRTLQPIQEAHERQRRFVADASHDLRNPLAAIRSTAESVLAKGTSARAREEALRSIVASAERLGSLTADLLLMARSERGLLEEAREPLDLSVVVAELVEQMGVLHPQADVAVDLAPDLLVRAHRQQVARILANILDNAIRYGERRVQVRARELDGDAVVEVADAGQGIAAADLGHLFDPFFRVRSDAAAPPGNGLGLAIADELARRNGGRLTVSTKAGEGSTFRLHLPRFR